ncbi:hypothetical protein E8E14_008123 [Neopestalotiopsis sp. 37M]|nr:hypothetical protein E8E14_008123 [Neopestalotiopsis sp. 37M]
MSNHESGLEVVTGPRAGSDGPQVIPRELESIPTALESWRAIHGPVEKEGQQPEAGNQAEIKPSDSGRSVNSARKGWKWCIIICVIVLVVVGIILGGVLGSRSGGQATNDSNPVSSPTGGNSSTQTLPIRNNSLLSVTGHKQENSGWTARLVFQGTDNKLRFLDRTGPDGAWSAVTTLGLVELAPNGSFGISTYLIGGITAAQYQPYYTSASGQLSGLIFKNGSTPMTGDADSINTLSFIAPNGTSVAT